MANIIYFLGDVQGCGFYRCGIPAKYLLRDGCNVTLLTTFGDNVFRWGDLFILQRQYDANLLKSVQKFVKKGKKFIYDLDDDIYNLPYWNPAAYLTKKEDIENSKIYLNIVNAVSASTSFLQGRLREITDRPITVIPNFLDFEFIDRPPPDSVIIAGKDFIPQELTIKQVEKEKRDGMVYIGWGGGFSHYNDLKFMLEPIFQICKEYKNVIFYTMAFCMEEFLKKFEWKQFRPIPAAHLFHYLNVLKMIDLDIGLAPLADNIFNESKSNLKVIEYLSLGITPLASNYRPYSKTLLEFDPSLLVEREEDWYNKLKWLIESKEKRDEVAVKGRNFVFENYNIAKSFTLWKDFFDEVLAL